MAQGLAGLCHISYHDIRLDTFRTRDVSLQIIPFFYCGWASYARGHANSHVLDQEPSGPDCPGDDLDTERSVPENDVKGPY